MFFKTKNKFVSCFIASMIVFLSATTDVSAKIKKPQLWSIINPGQKTEVVGVSSWGDDENDIRNWDLLPVIDVSQAIDMGATQVFDISDADDEFYVAEIPQSYLNSFHFLPIRFDEINYDEDDKIYLYGKNGDKIPYAGSLTWGQVTVKQRAETSEITLKQRAKIEINGRKGILPNAKLKRPVINSLVKSKLYGQEERKFLVIQAYYSGMEMPADFHSSSNFIMPLESKTDLEVEIQTINDSPLEIKGVRIKIQYPKKLKQGEVGKITVIVSGDNLTGEKIYDQISVVALEDIKIRPTFRMSTHELHKHPTKLQKKYQKGFFSSKGGLAYYYDEVTEPDRVHGILESKSYNLTTACLTVE